MRIGKVIGKVTLGRCHPSLKGATWIIAAPLYAAGLTDDAPANGDNIQGEPLVAFDEWGAGTGALIALSEGAEATAPFAPEQKPIDAYNTAILDNVSIKLKL
ncbi:MAG: carbon dioxide concentrating mechanism protein CcmL [Planctomycetota bacterium]|nr:carbon dioxide concentrating mechanism protein CcmL [Planctomycetota bacterium]MDA1211474.1 carbon dioxide concentrating mechanism protein CcmL [Planctomycetota bacterium]